LRRFDEEISNLLAGSVGLPPLRKGLSGKHVLFAVPKPPERTTYSHGRVLRVVDGEAVVRVFATTDDGFEETDREVRVPVERLRFSSEPLEKAVSERVMTSLREKAREHNEAVGDSPTRRVNARVLASVFERGVGAYRTNPGSVRPNVRSADQWAHARVNGFLHALATGKFKRSPYDTDLLPEGHPLSTRKEMSFRPPEGVREEARRALEWIEQGHAGDGFTDVGRRRASQLAAGQPVSRDTIARMVSFFARHEVDRKGKGFSRGEDGYPSPGSVAWAAWGGDAGRSWANGVRERVVKMECPVATWDKSMNMAARARAVDEADYGPLRPELDDEFWERLAGAWEVDVSTARARTCGSCAAFDQSEGMRECIEVGRVAEPSGTWFCRIYEFVCSDKRSCLSWAAARGSVMMKAEHRRFTLGPLYVPDNLDSQDEWTDPDTLQGAVWEWVRSGDRRVYLQHDRDTGVGEWVEVMTLPEPWETTLRDGEGNEMGRVEFPSGTVMLGVVWTKEAWPLVRDNKLRGYSMGGASRRVLADLPDEAVAKLAGL